MKVSDYIASFLSAHGIRTVFGHIGGFNADIVDSITANPEMEFVLNYHEQAAAFAANAYATITEGIGVAVSSGAPSSCNLIAGIANAFFDSIPCVFIAGSVHSKAVRKSPKIRQNAFEEIDMVSMVEGITKYAAKITNAEDIRFYLETAFYMASEGRHGPVLLDIPYDIARSTIETESIPAFNAPPQISTCHFEQSAVEEVLKSAKKPLFLVGGGAKSQKTKRSLKQFLEKTPIPVVASLCGLDVLPHDHNCFMGFLGHYGNRYANFALANCDCLIVLGSRLDERQIAGDPTRFAPNAKLIRIDIDQAELGRNILEHISIHSSSDAFLECLLNINVADCDYTKWLNVIATWKQRYPSYDLSLREVNANNFLHMLSKVLPKDCIICADVGQNQMFVAQSLLLSSQQRLLNSSGYGSMGFSLPAAVGAAYARKGASIISINGDGGIQMNIQELQTIVRDNLPVNIVILNNSCLGMIRRLQERIYDNRTVGSVEGYACPNYQAIATAYGLKYLRVDTVEQYSSIDSFLKGSGPKLIEVMLPQEILNNPEPGASIDRQTPLLSDEENKLILKEAKI